MLGTHKPIRKLLSILSLIVLLLLVACSGSQNTVSENPSGQKSASSGGVSGSNPANSSSGGSGATSAGAPSSSDNNNSSSDSFQKEVAQRQVIKSADVGLKVKDVRGGVGDLQSLASKLGGNVLSSDLHQGGSQLVANVTIQVPADKFNDALDGIRDLGTETSESIKGQDVTSEYVDLKSRERNLEASRQSLLGLMSKVKSVDDVLKVRRELDQVQGELEQVKGRIKYINSLVAMSRISVNLQPVVAPEAPPPAVVWRPLSVALNAWLGSVHFLQGLANVVIAVLVFCWWIIPLAVLAAVLWRRGGLRRPRLRGAGGGEG